VISIVIILIAHEQFYRVLIAAFGTDLHPIMEVERNRHVLARQIGVNGFACAVIGYIGYKNRHALSELMTLKRDDNFDKRIYGYSPVGFQILLYFFGFQVKNMYDTVIWEDGLLYIVHHLFAGVAAWLGMFPGAYL